MALDSVPYLVRICKGLDWKPWRLVALKDNELTENDLLLLDKIAEFSIRADANFNEIRDAYKANKELTVPAEIIRRY